MKVADFTPEELKALIRESVEEALADLIGDPDEGLELRDEVKERLLSMRSRSEPDTDAEEVAKSLGLSW